MKTFYLISTIILMFTGSRVLAQNQLCEESYENILTEINKLLEGDSQNTATGRNIDLDQAELYTGLHYIYSNTLPDSATYTFNGDTVDITFKSQRITGIQAQILDTLINNITGPPNNDDKPLTLAYATKKNIAQSYYISAKDLKEIFVDAGISTCTPDSSKGIRLYIAGSSLHEYVAGEISTHLYVVPQLRSIDETGSIEYTDKYVSVDNGREGFVRDLTTPCPNACGTNTSRLNWVRCDVETTKE